MRFDSSGILRMNACCFAGAKEGQVRSWLRDHLATAKAEGRAIVFTCKWYAWYFLLRHRTPRFSFFDALRFGFWLAQG
jgi:hypothetical protein